MNLSDIRKLLPDYADGELAADIRAELETLLAAHPELRAEVTRWQALRRCASRAMHNEPVPVGLADRVRAQLRSAPPGHSRFTTRRIWYLGLPGLAIAAGFVLALTLWTRGAAAKSVDVGGFARVYRNCAVARHHDKFGVCDTEAASAYAKIKTQAAFACDVPDLTTTGEYHVEGACRCPPSESVRAVHAYFQSNDGQNRIVSVFALDQRITLAVKGSACPTCGGGRRPYHAGADGPVTLLAWDQGDHSYVLAGEMPEPALMRLADGLSIAQLPRCDHRAETSLARTRTR